MKRAALERYRTVRVWLAHVAAHGERKLCACEFEPGRFRKSQRLGGCGRPRCWLCHGDKLAGRFPPQALRARVIYREGLSELTERDARSISHRS